MRRKILYKGRRADRAEKESVRENTTAEKPEVPPCAPCGVPLLGGTPHGAQGGTSGFSAVGFSAFCPSLGKYRTRTLALQKRRVQVRFHPKGCQAFCILFIKRISCKPFRLFQGSSEITPVNSVSRHKILAECLPNFPLSHKKYFFSAFKSTARRMCVSSAL